MLSEGLVGMGSFAGYYLVMASLLLIARTSLKLSGELFRKMLHIACVVSVFVLLYAIDTWHVAMFVALAFALVLYPIIALVERYPRLMAMLEARRDGELRSSLMLVFFMMATLIAFFWGGLGPQFKYMILVSVMAWGFGDAAAALVGRSWGRRRIHHRWVEGTKTVEGTSAMFAVSATAIWLTLLLATALPWSLCLLIAVLIAPIAAMVELISHRGIDTITVPYATAASALALIRLFAVVGVVRWPV